MRPRWKWPVLGMFMLVLGWVPAAGKALDYSEGADPTDDPSDDPSVSESVSVSLRRYVDASDGDDRNDGRSPPSAWKPLVPVNAGMSKFPAGSYILFKRGQTFAGDLKIGGVHGREGARVVFGAYGAGHSNGDGDPFNDSRPVIAGQVLFREAPSQWMMIRDLDIGKIAGGAVINDVVIFNNVAHGSDGKASNVIKLRNSCSLCAIVQNLVYDRAQSDLITLHSAPSNLPAAVESSHWIIYNVVVGNAGTESGIDFQVGEESRGEPLPVKGTIRRRLLGQHNAHAPASEALRRARAGMIEL